MNVRPGPRVQGCTEVVWMTAETAGQAVTVTLRALLLGKRWGHKVTATLCETCQAFHLASEEGERDGTQG